MKIKTEQIIKLLIICVIVFLFFRLLNQTNVENFENENNNNNYNSLSNLELNQIYGNLISIKNVKYNNDKTEVVLTLEKTVRLEGLIFELENDEQSSVNEQVNIYYADSKDNFNENYVVNKNVMNHSLVNNSKVTILNPLSKGGKNITTNKLKIKLLGESSFKLLKHWVFGMNNDSLNRVNFKNSLQKIEPSNISSTSDKNKPNFEIYKYEFDGNVNCYFLTLNVKLTTIIEDETLNRLNKSIPIEVHYKGIDNGVYKLDEKINTSDYNLVGDNTYVSNIYLQTSIKAKTIFIKVPKIHFIEGYEFTVDGINNVLFHCTKMNNENDKEKETFQDTSVGGYSADDLCPSLEAMEDKLKLTDQICARLEYNDKIQNEKIKLERNKQYILKLKEQDEEIKKLENIITSLQDKRKARDVYNDALRLAQLEKQKKQAVIIEDLAKKRAEHRKNNIVNVDLNLKTKPQF